MSPPMHYLIHTPQYTCPYHTKLHFIAQDFSAWNFRVESHPSGSPYISEFLHRERRNNPARWKRYELLRIWACEVVRRSENGEAATTPAGAENAMRILGRTSRQENVSRMLQDFVLGIAEHDHPGPSPPSITLVSTYMSLLSYIRYSANSRVPAWAPHNVTHADRLILELRCCKKLDRAHIQAAANRVVNKGGRMFRMEKRGDFLRVELWVAYDRPSRRGECEEEEMEECLPVYEEPPAYEELEAATEVHIWF